MADPTLCPRVPPTQQSQLSLLLSSLAEFRIPQGSCSNRLMLYLMACGGAGGITVILVIVQREKS